MIENREPAITETLRMEGGGQFYRFIRSNLL